MRLDELTRELYGVTPGEFVALRDQYVRQARQAGQRELATRLRALRRPTHTAWLVNLLVRQQPGLVDELLELGARFRGGELTRQQLAELAGARRELLRRVVEQAGVLSSAVGGQLSEERAREIEATFGAALADPAAAEQLQAGQLTTALSYAGFGPQLQLVPSVDAGAAPNRPAGEAASTPSRRSQRAEAAAAVRSAERALLDGTRARDRAAARRDRLAQRRDDLRTELELVRSRLAVVQGELDDAQQLLHERHTALTAMQQELDEARARLDGLD